MTKLEGENEVRLLPRLLAGLRGKVRRPEPTAVQVEVGLPGGERAEGLGVAITWQGGSEAYEVALYDHGRRRWRYFTVGSTRAELDLPEGLYHVAVRALHGSLGLAGEASGFVFFRVHADAVGETRPAASGIKGRSLGELAQQQAAVCWKPPNAEPLKGPPRTLLVGGAPRSGTTLLQAILCADPAANPVIAEVAPLRALLANHAQILRHHNLYPETWFANETALGRFTGDMILSFLDSISDVQKCQRLILKEPALTKWFPSASELIEDVGFIVIVRDPRDAIASMIEVAEREMRAGRPSFIANRDPVELARYYNSFYAPLFNCQQPQFTRALRYIRYEDIVDEPLDATAGLGEAFGLDLSGFRADRPGWRSKVDFASASLPSRTAVTGHYNQPVTKASVGSYRTTLDADTVAVIEEHCAAIMATFDYRKEADKTAED